MKLMNFIIFFSIVILFLTLVHFYIISKGLQVIPADSSFRVLFIFGVIFLASSFLIVRIIERFYSSILTDILIWIGAFWLGIMVFILLQLLLIDAFRLFFYLAGVKKYPSVFGMELKIALAILIMIVSLSAGIIGLYFNRSTVIKKLELEINKNAGDLLHLNIAVASDIHLGTLINNSFLEKLVNKINKLNADIILLPGDIIDEDLTPVIKKNLGENLKNLKSKYGVYAVTGNHEYIGGVITAKEYLVDHGINILEDSAVLIDNSFYVAGREDYSISSFTNGKRKPLSEILDSADFSLPVILLDHQPFHLEDAMNHGIDLQLSGHTHHGQIWPFNYITEKIYELSWGYKQKGNTHYYVSCGAGGWGPPIRLGSRSEIVQIKLSFNGIKGVQHE